MVTIKPVPAGYQFSITVEGMTVEYLCVAPIVDFLGGSLFLNELFWPLWTVRTTIAGVDNPASLELGEFASLLARVDGDLQAVVNVLDQRMAGLYDQAARQYYD